MISGHFHLLPGVSASFPTLKNSGFAYFNTPAQFSTTSALSCETFPFIRSSTVTVQMPSSLPQTAEMTLWLNLVRS